MVVVDKVGRLVARTRGTEYVKVTAGGRTVKYKITVLETEPAVWGPSPQGPHTALGLSTPL
mgnify:CR=1 FL=1